MSVSAVPFNDLSHSTAQVRVAVDQAWADLLGSGHFVSGAAVERFEQEWAAYCGTDHAVGVANGTDALQLTLMGLGIGWGDEVIVPANTFVATAEAVVLAGATPRFADVSPETLLLTTETLESAITSRTRAVIVVHLYGQMADMDALSRVSDAAGLLLIEDAAQAHGATWNGRAAGSVGRAGCFSFYPGKNLGAFGDAGAIVTSDPDLARDLRCLRDHGRAPGSRYEHIAVGTNSRLDTLQAAVLSAKLPHLDAWTESRRGIADAYRLGLATGPVSLVGNAAASRSVYHLAVARTPRRDRLRARLSELGIGTGVHYPIPCHLQAPFRRYADRCLPVAEEAAGAILSLPMFPHLTAEQVQRVCTAIEEVAADDAVAAGDRG